MEFLSNYLNLQLCVAWSGDYARSTESVISGLTSNEALRTILCYSWLDHGTPPKDSPFLARLRESLFWGFSLILI